jgi:hypothetical protein
MGEGGHRVARAVDGIQLRRIAGLGLWLALLAACGPAETPRAELPPLRIAVEIDLEPGPPVDAARLAVLPPDLENGERRAWDLGPLLGERYYERGARLDVIDSGGTSVSFSEPSRRQDGRRPALVLNQKGEWFVELVEPDAETAHGRGGNRGRPAARTQRMTDVAQLRLFTPSGGVSRRRPRESNEVQVVMDGERVATWTPESLAKVPKLPIDRLSPRLQKAWGLREAVSTLPGPPKRVVRVGSSEGRSLEIPEELWKDAAQIPVMRLNQRGMIKLEWIDASGRRSSGPEVRGLTRVELARVTP